MRGFLTAALITAAILPRVTVCADSYALAEAGSKTVLIEENASEKYPCGTLSKLMTVLIAAEKIKAGELSFDAEITVSEHANSMQGAQIWLMPDDKISVRDLLKGIIIGNANDAACALAEGISGSEEGFTELMNEKALSLDMTDTLYKNSCGYKSNGDHTTARDTVILLCELSKYDFLTDIFTTRTEYILNDTVQLVTSNPKAMKYGGAIGFKTGFREKDGKKIYFSAEGARRGGETYVSAVLEEDDEDICAARAFSLIDRGFSEYETASPEVPAELPREIRVKNGIIPNIGIEVRNTGRTVVSAGTADRITCRAALPEFVYAPVKRGEKVGELIFYYNDKFIYTADITAVRSSEEKSFKYNMLDMLKKLASF